MPAKNTTTDYIEKMIRQNCLKYNGLNISAEEFIPQNKPDNNPETPQETPQEISQETPIKIEIDENDFFDKLEFEYVQQNAWLFE